MEFDIQRFLSEMRVEQREVLSEMRVEQKADHKDLSEKIDSALKTLQDHELRLTIVENTRKAVRWLGATAIVGFITLIVELIAAHSK